MGRKRASRKNGRYKVEFTATRKVPKKRRVSFKTSSGEKVTFIAKKYVQKKEKVSFYARKK